MSPKQIILAVLAVIGVQFVLGISIYAAFDSWQDRGTFGDMFGAVNTLFSGLAFVGVVYAIVLQSKELELQREELRETRLELGNATKAQEFQAEQLLLAAKINAISTKVTAFSTLQTGANHSIPDYSNNVSHDLGKALIEHDGLLGRQDA